MSISLAALRNEVKVNEQPPENLPNQVDVSAATISIADLRAVSQAELKKSKKQTSSMRAENKIKGKIKSKSNQISLEELKKQPVNSKQGTSNSISLSDLKKNLLLLPKTEELKDNDGTEASTYPPLAASSLHAPTVQPVPTPSTSTSTPETLHPVSITSNTKKNSEAIQSEIEVKEDAEFRAKHAVYFKMAKLGIPLPNIEQKLLMDQVDLLLMEQILTKLGGSTSSVFSCKVDLKEATALSRVKLQRLHWKPLDASHLTASSLWTSVAKDSGPAEGLRNKGDRSNSNSNSDDDDDDATVAWNNVLSPEDTDLINNDLTANLDEHELSEVEFFFGIDLSKTNPKRGELSETSKINKLHLPKVLDLQRAMNVAIGLSTFKSISRMRYVLNGVCSLNNLGNKLTPEKLLNLTSMLPTLPEAKALQSVITVNKGEIFCKLAMEYYPHLSGRLSCFLTVISFEEIYQSVVPKLKIFIKSIDNILNSSNLALIFTKILAIGNALNKGTAMGEAAGFSLESLLRTMSLKGGSDKKMSVLDLSVKILREKGFLDILHVVHDICEVEEACKLSPDNIFTEINIFNEEYEELSVELKNAQNYLTLYYQGALDNWLQSIAPGSTYVIKEDDMITCPFGDGIMKEVRDNGMLMIRPSKWRIINEVEHMMYIHKDQVTVRPPFLVGDVVMTRHGHGVIEEVRVYDSVAVIRPVTWGSSASSTPCIFEPIVSLRHQHKHQDEANYMSESDMPMLTQKFIDKLKIFLRSSNKRKKVNKLKTQMGEKIQELANYFGEKLHDDGITYVSETFEILKVLRHSLIKSYKIGPKKIPEPPVKKVKFCDAPAPAAAAACSPTGNVALSSPLLPSTATAARPVFSNLRHVLRPMLNVQKRRHPSYRYHLDYPFKRLTLTKKMMLFFRNVCPVQRIVSLYHFRVLDDDSSSSDSSDSSESESESESDTDTDTDTSIGGDSDSDSDSDSDGDGDSDDSNESDNKGENECYFNQAETDAEGTAELQHSMTLLTSSINALSSRHIHRPKKKSRKQQKEEVSELIFYNFFGVYYTTSARCLTFEYNIYIYIIAEKGYPEKSSLQEKVNKIFCCLTTEAQLQGRRRRRDREQRHFQLLLAVHLYAEVLAVAVAVANTVTVAVFTSKEYS
jgi:hypothetical protein